MCVQVHEDRMIELVEQLTSGKHSPFLPACPLGYQPACPVRCCKCPFRAHLRCQWALASHAAAALLTQLFHSPFGRPAADRPEGKWLSQLELVPQGERLAVQEKEQVGLAGSGRILR